MSFMDSSASTSLHQDRNNSMNFDSISTDFSPTMRENESESLLMGSSRVAKCPKSTISDNSDPRHVNLCYDYNKCFANTFQYNENGGYDYNVENAYGLSTAVNQSFNTANSYSYNFNDESHELQNQAGEFSINFNRFSILLVCECLFFIWMRWKWVV